MAQLEAEEYHWKVASFVPSEVLFAARNKRRMYAALVMTLLGLALLFGSWQVAKNVTLRRQAQERLRDLLLIDRLGSWKVRAR